MDCFAATLRSRLAMTARTEVKGVLIPVCAELPYAGLSRMTGICRAVRCWYFS